jgi:hypothetical protein
MGSFVEKKRGRKSYATFPLRLHLCACVPIWHTFGGSVVREIL